MAEIYWWKLEFFFSLGNCRKFNIASNFSSQIEKSVSIELYEILEMKKIIIYLCFGVVYEKNFFKIKFENFKTFVIFSNFDKISTLKGEIFYVKTFSDIL